MEPKHMIREKLEQNDQWRGWRDDVMDYCEVSLPGMKKVLDNTNEAADEIGGKEVGE